MDNEIKILVEKIRAAKTIALFAHKNPDGDALCSVLALSRLIYLNFGINPVCVYDGNIPDCLDNVPDRHYIKYFEKIDSAVPFDLAIVLDYGTKRNIGGTLTILDAAHDTVEIDHHKHESDNVAKLCLNNDSAAATGEIIFDIMHNQKWKYDRAVLDLLAVSILTDTGFFRYSRHGHVLRIMADLVDLGVNIDKLATGLNNKPCSTVQTEAAIVSNAEFVCDGQVAVAVVSKQDYKNLDGRGDIILNLLGQIAGVEYIVLLKEQKDNQIGISLRGKTKPVNHIATAFGGGGHLFAAGAVVIDDNLENVRSKVIELIRGQL